MPEDVFKVALAGLLYDISSLAGRANRDPTTQALVERLVPAGYRLPDGPGPNVALAAWLAAGGQAAASVPPRQMLSIFCDLELQARDEAGQAGAIPLPPAQYLPLKELQVREDTIFPGEPQAEIGAAYADLWQTFETQALALKRVHDNGASDIGVYLRSLLKLMERYAWAVPSSYAGERPTVSLVDHSRMTGGLAACLAGQTLPAAVEQVPGDTEVALLVGGDISGVQDFIYTITSRGATSALRGRSLYLQLLTEVIARYVLQQVEMPPTNLIYAGGGHFYLLAPIGSRAKLVLVQQRISEVLLRHHQGDLYLAIAAKELRVKDFQGRALSERWRAVGEQLQTAKQQRFAELGEAMAGQVFKPLERGGGEEELCVVCQREHPQTEEIEGVRKCPACIGFEELGDDLRSATYLGLAEIDAQPLPAGAEPPGAWDQVLGHFGYRVSLTIDDPQAEATRRDWHELLALTDEALAALEPSARQATGRHFLVNVTPRLTRAEYETWRERIEDLPFVDPKKLSPVKPFEVMARQATGIKRLGVLRMDVDNLGQIFGTGLGERANLARVATLSFTMRLFFEGWVEQIAKEFNKPEQPHLVYSIYSGGDDLFFVGAWHLMTELAETISRDLTRYAAGHPGIHMSGGITLAPSKYPLYQAAADAHEAEEAAKANRELGRKNALNFLDQTIPWPRYDRFKTMQTRLLKLVEPGNGQPGVPRSLIRRLIQLYADYAQARTGAELGESVTVNGQPQLYWGRGQWLSAYSLSRLAQRVGRSNPAAQQEIEEIRDQLKLEQFSNIAWIGLAARWAELLVRTDRDESG